jgi:Asp/Glu/hydantoin racemase
VGSILLINPNSSAPITRSMEACIGDLRARTSHTVTAIELAKSPPGIETDAHVEAAIPNILEVVEASPADSYILGCFSDPGIETVRRAALAPVLGIAESAYLVALGLGKAFGIVSLGPSSIARHWRYLVSLKLERRLAGDRSIDMTIPQLIANDVVETVSRTARQLRDEDGADVVILGCAGLGSYRDAIEAELGLPVVDPVQAAVARAIGMLDLNYGRKAR